jgi:aspartokinase/homoserine dehydrogenase 1
VHKFGGASLATADLYVQCSDLLVTESRRTLDDTGSCAPTMAIVSAKGGVTDRLIAVVQAARNDMAEASEILRTVAAEQLEIVRQIGSPERAEQVAERLEADTEDIINVVRAVSLLKTVPPSTMELVTGYGEVWSAMTMHAYLETTGKPTAWLDAREVLTVEQTGFGLGEKGSSNVVGVDPLWEVTSTRVAEWFAAEAQEGLLSADCVQGAPIVVVTGFVASTLEGTPTTLKRSGSDYSATIFARLMHAKKITMWKNVNGVYTADPRRVPEAFPIASLKYDEAIELAFFGAQVLHPSAMMPCIEDRIPIYVRNVFNPEHPGTVIEGRACSLEDSVEAWGIEAMQAREQSRRAACPVRLDQGESPIRGITSVDNVAILNIEGTGTSAVPDLSSRIFSTLSNANVQPVMVTQASADSSICLVVEEGVVDRALAVLNQAFESELRKRLVAGITAEYGHSVVAIVGEGMAFRPGTGAAFTRAMAQAGVNIRTIAQGSSERQISICVEKHDCTKALRAAHAALALSNTQLCVAVIGATGMVGSELLQQLADSKRVFADPQALSARRQVLDDLRLDFKVTAVARQGMMRLSYDGLDVSTAEDLFADEATVQPSDLDALTAFLNEDYNGNRVVIDCSASQQVSDYYARWMALGIHVITANKKAGSGDAPLYDEIKLLSRGGRAQWYYETTGPGSGLPVLTTVKDMMQSGDRVYGVKGIFSGSISYMLNEVLKGVPLSQALLKASEEGLCEPDPRDDLTGKDVRRKVVVLARELGLRLELDDVACDSLLPSSLVEWAPDTSDEAPSLAAQLAVALQPFDEETTSRILAMADGGLVPLQLCEVDMASETASVKIEALPSTDRIAKCEANENIIEIATARYSPRSMVMQGPGAGAQITASGLFADLLHLARTLVEWNA